MPPTSSRVIFISLILMCLPLAGCLETGKSNLRDESYRLQRYEDYHGGDAALVYLAHIDRLPQPVEYGYTHRGRSYLVLDGRKENSYVNRWIRSSQVQDPIPLRALPGRHEFSLQGEREIDTPHDGSVYDPDYPKKFYTKVSNFKADLGALEVWVLLGFWDGEQYGYALLRLGERGKLGRVPPFNPNEEYKIGDRRVSSSVMEAFHGILNRIVGDTNT